MKKPQTGKLYADSKRSDNRLWPVNWELEGTRQPFSQFLESVTPLFRAREETGTRAPSESTFNEPWVVRVGPLVLKGLLQFVGLFPLNKHLSLLQGKVETDLLEELIVTNWFL